MPAASKAPLEASQVFAPHVPLLKRPHLEASAQHDGGFVPTLDARDLEFGEDPVGEDRVRGESCGNGPHDAQRDIDFLTVGDADVDDGIGVSTAHVRDRRNQPVRDEVHVAVVVAQLHVAQRQVLHEDGLAGDLDDVALDDLVLHQQEDPGEVVLHQALRAESDGEPDDAGGAEDRRDRDAAFWNTRTPPIRPTATVAR